MELGGIQTAITDVKDTLSFLPGWAVGAIVLALAVLVSLGLHLALGRIGRRALAGQPFLLSLVERTRALSRLALVTIAVGLVLPAVSLPANVEYAV